MDKIRSIFEKISDKYTNLKQFFDKTYNRHSLYMYTVISIVLTLIIEMMARKSFLKGIYYLIASPYIFLCNAVIILMTLSFSLLTKRRVFALTLVSSVWIVFGIANAILLSKRVTPLTGADLTLLDAGLKVADKYLSVWNVIFIIVVIFLVIAGLVFTFIKAPKITHKIKYVRAVIAIIVIWAVGFGGLRLGVASGLIPKRFGNLRDCYRDYGFVYCFTNTITRTGVSKPESYSGEKIKEITGNKKKGEEVTKKPNIIFLQLESFFDLNNMKNIKLSGNPTPNFENLMKEYPSGYFSVPVVGAGTVNTEFEVMTGMNMDSFGPGEYPFRTILRNQTCESICYNLKGYGYHCHAIHNNSATFYERDEVFPNLGYDTFTGIENMHINHFTPMGWAKDYYLTDQIMDALESTKDQDFVYAISVQGHGSYPTEGEYNYPFKISGLEDEELTNQYQYYAWQISEMDKFIGELLDAVKEKGEDTIVVMYGDHLPSLGITADNLKSENVYQTQYCIWSNFDVEYSNEDIEAYQLESKILEQLNMTAGKINLYTQQHKNDDENDYQEGLQNLEYDQLYGDFLAYGGNNPYKPVETQIGIHPIRFKSVSPLNDDTGTVYVYGENFTKYSKVYVDGNEQNTKYLDPDTLKIEYPELKEGQKIKVCLKNDDHEILDETEEFSYQQEDKLFNKKTKNRKQKKQKTKK